MSRYAPAPTYALPLSTFSWLKPHFAEGSQKAIEQAILLSPGCKHVSWLEGHDELAIGFLHSLVPVLEGPPETLEILELQPL